MSKCLVTGGAGFIGSNLVDRLIDEEYEVVVIDDLSTGRKDYINPQARFYNVDITSSGDVESVFAKESQEGKINYIFHLAAQVDVRVSVDDPYKDNKINLIGGINVLENARKNNAEKILFISTGGAVYGDVEEIPTTESKIPEPVSPYGIHKLALEKYLNYYYQVYGVPYCIFRLANVYGPRQYKDGEAGVITIFIDNVVNGRQSILYGDGSQTRDFVYVDDVVEAFLKGVNKATTDVFNISTGVETRVSEIIKIMESIIGEKMDLQFQNPRPGEQQRSCLDLSKAEQILGWKPQIDIKEGIRKTLKWSRNQKVNND